MPATRRLRSLLACVVAAAALLAGPAGAAGTAPADVAAPAPAATPDPLVKLGPLTREQVEECDPRFVTAEAESTIDAAAARALLAVPPGARVTVYLGTWCSDSRRELGRFWRALDEVGALVPFTVTYVGVDRDKTGPAELLAGTAVTHLPTFVVEREAGEVGRVVETAPHGIERDLADLLAGVQQGYLSASQPPAAPAPPADGAKPPTRR
jgi:hypothetical protein